MSSGYHEKWPTSQPFMLQLQYQECTAKANIQLHPPNQAAKLTNQQINQRTIRPTFIWNSYSHNHRCNDLTNESANQVRISNRYSSCSRCQCCRCPCQCCCVGCCSSNSNSRRGQLTNLNVPNTNLFSPADGAAHWIRYAQT